MPPKNKGKNAFFFFMLDWKKREEATGRQFPSGLKDVQSDPACSEEWQSMTKHEKSLYVSKAKSSKVDAQMNVEKKTTLGECVRTLEEKQKMIEEYQHTMQTYIHSIVSMGIRHNNLEKLKFIFIHANYFCMRQIQNECDYVPAEFAVANFSLGNGIENIYHEIINTKIPLGFAREARETSQEQHQIPIEMPGGQKDFLLMYNKLIKFLRPNMNGDKYPPLFATKDVADVVKSLLKRMTEAANVEEDVFLIYSLETLFADTRNAAATKANGVNIHLVVAHNEFTKDTFCYSHGLDCEFHENIDGGTKFCSKAVVQRWGMTMCDYCCKLLEIELIPGVHCPLKPAGLHFDTMKNRMSSLRMDDTRNGILSITGVSQSHKLRVSERTHQAEQLRRNTCKPLEIIDHSKSNKEPLYVAPKAPVVERPLRAPKTLSQAVMMGSLENSAPSMDAMNFPPIGGRGTAMKKRAPEYKSPLGKGRGSC